MAVSAYASLLSLTQFLDNLHYRAQFQIPRADIKQVETLQDHVCVLLEFVERRSEEESQEIKALWRQIAEAAFEAEDKINFHVVRQLGTRSGINFHGVRRRYMESLGGTSDDDFSDIAEDTERSPNFCEDMERSLEEPSDDGFFYFCEDVERLIQKFHSIRNQLPTIKEEGEDVQAGASVPAPSSTTSRGKSVVVGLDEHVRNIKDMLITDRSNLQTLPIVGMGGIGKTTLAKSVFEDQYIVRYFDERIWLTISQEYRAEDILRHLLDEDEESSKSNLAELGDKLHKRLFNRRFLIVMDDMWSSDAWYELKQFFPENGIKSRIMLTTRLLSIGPSLGSCEPYRLTFLDEETCWDLFCQNTFGQLGCPQAHLEKIAEKIVKSCKGLPLEIVVISRLLANSNLTLEYWESIVENISSFGNTEDDEHCLKILSLSYRRLPIHLKPCFLYLRKFREDASISVSNLIKCWIGEGFIKSVNDKHLNDSALECVQELIDRNLVFTRQSSMVIGVHDLLRDLCLRESNHERFFQSPKVQYNTERPHTCFLCGDGKMNNNAVHLQPKSTPVCYACKMMYPRITLPLIVRKEQRRFGGIKSNRNGDRILLTTTVRFASLECFGAFKVEPTIHLLWNLQYLNIHKVSNSEEIILPPHIWEMPQLRSILADNAILSNPIPIHIVGKDLFVLKNLEMLAHIRNFKFTKEIFDRLPNIRELGIEYHGEYKKKMELLNSFFNDLVQLQHLDSLSVHVNQAVLESITFPNSLKQLSLSGWTIAWQDMSIIGSIPSLEKLKLHGYMQGSEWNPRQGEFIRLKDLSISNSYLVHWSADQSHFPILKHLELSDFHSLQGIPSGIGDILTLDSIVLWRCSDSAIDSAKKIWEERQEMGNEIRIHVWGGKKNYQIGPIIARLSEKAIESLAYLKIVPGELQEVADHGRDYLNTKQIETLEEDAHFLRDFVKDHCRWKSQGLEILSSQIAKVCRKTRLACYVVHDKSMRVRAKYLPENVEKVLDMMTYIKNRLSVAKEEREDDEAGYESLQLDASDINAASDHIESLSLLLAHKFDDYINTDTEEGDADTYTYSPPSKKSKMTNALGLTEKAFESLVYLKIVLGELLAVTI